MDNCNGALGPGLIVVKAKSPVVPARYWNLSVWPARDHPRPKRVIVCYGKPIDFTKLLAEAETCSKPRLKEIYREISAGHGRHRELQPPSERHRGAEARRMSRDPLDRGYG